MLKQAFKPVQCDMQKMTADCKILGKDAKK